MALGDYPEGYNKNVHGPFDPARYYGKRKYEMSFLRKPMLSRKVADGNSATAQTLRVQQFRLAL